MHKALDLILSTANHFNTLVEASNILGPYCSNKTGKYIVIYFKNAYGKVSSPCTFGFSNKKDFHGGGARGKTQCLSDNCLMLWGQV